jgi:hypothetical protein
MYTKELEKMTAAEVWQAWKKQLLTMGQVVTWQTKNKTYFDSEGNITI